MGGYRDKKWKSSTSSVEVVFSNFYSRFPQAGKKGAFQEHIVIAANRITAVVLKIFRIVNSLNLYFKPLDCLPSKNAIERKVVQRMEEDCKQWYRKDKFNALLLCRQRIGSYLHHVEKTRPWPTYRDWTQGRSLLTSALLSRSSARHFHENRDVTKRRKNIDHIFN